MNRELMRALGAVAADFHHDALQRHADDLVRRPEHLPARILLIWRVLVLVDDLLEALDDALVFDQARRRCTSCRPSGQEHLPF